MNPSFVLILLVITSLFQIIILLKIFDISKPSVAHHLSVANFSNISRITKWILGFESPINTVVRPPEESKTSTDILLLQRKLALLCVQEVNQRLVGTPCGVWWANPLSVTSLEAEPIGEGQIEYKVNFKVQPGSLPFECTVRMRRNFSHPYQVSEFFPVSATRLDDHSRSCVDSDLSEICLCPKEKVEAERITALERSQMSKVDPELASWPAHVPMLVSEYIRFGEMNMYLRTPGDSVLCGDTVKLLIFISSAPSHFEGRENIRKTFGNKTFLEQNEARLLFLFGGVNDAKLQAKIDAELQQKNDIVQANFSDSYLNLTLSHLSMYNWAVTHCRDEGLPLPGWMLKADDHYFLNVPLARMMTDANPDIEMICVPFCGSGARAVRVNISKYYVPRYRYMYAPDYYVGYPSGAAYLIRTDVLKPMLQASLVTPMLSMDDCYLGLLAKEIGIHPRTSRLIRTGVGKNEPCNIRNMMDTDIYGKSHEWRWREFNDQANCSVNGSLLPVNTLTQDQKKWCLFD